MGHLWTCSLSRDDKFSGVGLYYNLQPLIIKQKTIIFIAKFMSKFERTFSSSPDPGIIVI
jgi:hypothetical protein